VNAALFKQSQIVIAVIAQLAAVCIVRLALGKPKLTGFDDSILKFRAAFGDSGTSSGLGTSGSAASPEASPPGCVQASCSNTFSLVEAISLTITLAFSPIKLRLQPMAGMSEISNAAR
jgi:hypothetical protein